MLADFGADEDVGGTRDWEGGSTKRRGKASLARPPVCRSTRGLLAWQCGPGEGLPGALPGTEYGAWRMPPLRCFGSCFGGRFRFLFLSHFFRCFFHAFDYSGFRFAVAVSLGFGFGCFTIYRSRFR